MFPSPLAIDAAVRAYEKAEAAAVARGNLDGDQVLRIAVVAAIEKMLEVDEMIGCDGVAELAGVRTATVHMWRKRRALPEPAEIANPGQHPMWFRRDIIAWLRETGRIST